MGAPLCVRNAVQDHVTPRPGSFQPSQPEKDSYCLQLRWQIQTFLNQPAVAAIFSNWWNAPRSKENPNTTGLFPHKAKLSLSKWHFSWRKCVVDQILRIVTLFRPEGEPSSKPPPPLLSFKLPCTPRSNLHLSGIQFFSFATKTTFAAKHKEFKWTTGKLAAFHLQDFLGSQS